MSSSAGTARPARGGRAAPITGDDAPSISRVVLRDQVKDLLLERILRGDLQPGERLVETRIAQELGMSQAPIREALRDLELMRLVESSPFRTTRVRQVANEDLAAVFPVRAALEELAAKAVARSPDSDLGPVRAELEEMRRAVARGDIRSLLGHDIAFHRAIVEASGNAPLLQAWLAVGIEAATAFGVYHTLWSPEELLGFHEPVLAALEARDVRRAGSEARRHVQRTERVVRRRIRERAGKGG